MTRKVTFRFETCYDEDGNQYTADCIGYGPDYIDILVSLRTPEKVEGTRYHSETVTVFDFEKEAVVAELQNAMARLRDRIAQRTKDVTICVESSDVLAAFGSSSGPS